MIISTNDFIKNVVRETVKETLEALRLEVKSGVQVTYCEDCMYCEPPNDINPFRMCCEHHGIKVEVEGSHFCAYGYPRDMV